MAVVPFAARSWVVAAALVLATLPSGTATALSTRRGTPETATVSVVPGPGKGTVVLPLGDSITYGCGDNCTSNCSPVLPCADCTTNGTYTPCARFLLHQAFKCLPAPATGNPTPVHAAEANTVSSKQHPPLPPSQHGRPAVRGARSQQSNTTPKTLTPYLLKNALSRHTSSAVPFPMHQQGLALGLFTAHWGCAELTLSCAVATTRAASANHTEGLVQAVAMWAPYARQASLVLLHIGTNDILQNDYPSPDAASADMAAQLAGLLDLIKAEAPSAHVLVASIISFAPTRYYQSFNAQADAYNAAVPSVVAAFSSGGGKATFVDMANGPEG
eukprot:gene2253-3125_t